MISFFCANVEQKSPGFACSYWVQDAEIPFCIGDGIADPLVQEPEVCDDDVLVKVVELTKGANGLPDGSLMMAISGFTVGEMYNAAARRVKMKALVYKVFMAMMKAGIK